MLDDPATSSMIFACLDGHGIDGEKISSHFKARLEELPRHEHFLSDTKRAICELVSDTEEELLRALDVETRMSGTTMVLAVVIGNKLTIANIGDSRAVIGCSTSKQSPPSGIHLEVTALSSDHTPTLPLEKARILDNGGRVASVKYADGFEGPPRVWLKDQNLPGLAMSRSLCDSLGHGVGVISTPEFTERYLNRNSDCMLILATDGVFQFLSNQEVMDIACRASEGGPSQSVVAIVGQSIRKWKEIEGRVDDITCCVAYLQGMPDSNLYI
jgi:serine/threonine protein phosphatase PrpC